ncbi:MAG: ROK family protein [Firmicutes bacterium]|nr:ROK family protein [Bacillota bacterium]PZN38355.1 MAG: glucokinase [Bacillota bacterium]
MSGRCAIGLDVGGTKILGGLVDETGRVLLSRRIPTPVAEGPAGVFAAMRRLIRELLDQAGDREVVGIGLGMPGLIDRQRGISVHSPNTGWSNVPVLPEFTEFGLPVDMENDVRCHALGEYWFGAGRGVRHFVLLTLGTGLGSGIVVDGELFQGGSGMPGEIGHVVVDPQGPPCGCGNRGCLEALVGGRGLARRAREAGIARDVQELIALARAGEPRALGLVEEVARHLGWGISIMANLFNPQRVILGGGLAKALGDLLFGSLRRYAEAMTMPGIRGTYDIVPAALGEEAGVVGAAALFPALTGGAATIAPGPAEPRGPLAPPGCGAPGSPAAGGEVRP